jgi:hypothetical protein
MVPHLVVMIIWLQGMVVILWPDAKALLLSGDSDDSQAECTNNDPLSQAISLLGVSALNKR